MDVSFTKCLTVDFRFLDKSLMQIRKNKGPSIDPCGTPAFTPVQEDA